MGSSNEVKATTVDAVLTNDQMKEELEIALKPILDDAGVETGTVFLEELHLEPNGELEITMVPAHALTF